jgi:hypothetical protein
LTELFAVKIAVKTNAGRDVAIMRTGKISIKEKTDDGKHGCWRATPKRAKRATNRYMQGLTAKHGKNSGQRRARCFVANRKSLRQK